MDNINNNINDNINRVWIISDTHFGIKDGDQKWIDIAKTWRDKFLIPTIIENAKPGDYLFHLGDVFDKRTSLNINVLNFTIETFEILTSIFSTLNINNPNHNYNQIYNQIYNNTKFKDIQNTHSKLNNPQEFNNAVLTKYHANILNMNSLSNTLNYNSKAKLNDPLNDVNSHRKLKNPSNVKVIIGNHDIFRKHTNTINTINILKWLPNLEIITEKPKILNVRGNKGILVPWVSRTSDEKKIIEELDDIHFYFAHTSVQGAFYSGRRVVDHGLEKTDYGVFKRVYSGHIHTTQIAGNVKFVGNPYEMTRNDRGNPKFVLLIDFEKEEEIEYYNDVSPRWQKFTWEAVENSDVLAAAKKRGDRIDVELSEEDMNTEKVRNFMKEAEDSGIDVLLTAVDRTSDEKEDIILYDAENTQIPEILEEEVKRRVKNDSTAAVMSKFLMDLYKRNL